MLWHSVWMYSYCDFKVQYVQDCVNEFFLFNLCPPFTPKWWRSNIIAQTNPWIKWLSLKEWNASITSRRFWDDCWLLTDWIKSWWSHQYLLIIKRLPFEGWWNFNPPIKGFCPISHLPQHTQEQRTFKGGICNSAPKATTLFVRLDKTVSMTWKKYICEMICKRKRHPPTASCWTVTLGFLGFAEPSVEYPPMEFFF